MRNTNGFTLIEMSVIICIIGILFSGGLKLIGTHIDMRRTAENNARLAEARDAVIGYAIANKGLPCPGDANGDEGPRNSLNAIPRTTRNSCISVNGVLPWNALGVRKTDVWGQTFTYHITKTYSRKSIPNPPFIAIVPPGILTKIPGDLSIFSKEDPSKYVAADVVAVIISNGPDKNLNAEINTRNFYSSDAAIPGFDDQVVWVTASTLLRDYVKAGRYEKD